MDVARLRCVGALCVLAQLLRVLGLLFEPTYRPKVSGPRRLRRRSRDASSIPDMLSIDPPLKGAKRGAARDPAAVCLIRRMGRRAFWHSGLSLK